MISILIATYNSEKTIDSALKSVKEQILQDWECIIIDGASKDRTLDVVKSYSEKDNRFSFISEPDKGVFDALNKGVMMAKGEWIYVLGSDDRLTKDGLYNFVKNKDRDSSVIYGDAIAKFADGREHTIRTKSPSYMRFNMITSHQAMIVKKSVMMEFGNFDIRFRLCADFDLFQKIYLKGYKFQYIKTPVAYYGMEGLSNGFSFKNDWDKYKVCKKNHSNSCPLFFFLLDEVKWILAQIRDKVLR